MSEAAGRPPRLVADVGGTHTRIALYAPRQDRFVALRSYFNRDFADLESILGDWRDHLGDDPPRTACIAIAAALKGDRVRMSNINWSFSLRELQARLGLTQVRWINDLQSNAYALPHLGAADYQTLHAGKHHAVLRRAVLGPGTGLGGAFVEQVAGTLHAAACEPGQMGLSPQTDQEVALFRILLRQHRDIYAELLVSGPGLWRLYETLAALRGEALRAQGPQDISRRALEGSDALCQAALEQFCALLGSVCGDFVLATGSYGGLFLSGGIVPRIAPFLSSSNFLQRLQDKGTMSGQLAEVPVHIITTPQPALVGAAHAPLRA
ncbi:MAG: glucokinase [Parahaliea sp.]